MNKSKTAAWLATGKDGLPELHVSSTYHNNGQVVAIPLRCSEQQASEILSDFSRMQWGEKFVQKTVKPASLRDRLRWLFK